MIITRSERWHYQNVITRIQIHYQHHKKEEKDENTANDHHTLQLVPLLAYNY